MPEPDGECHEALAVRVVQPKGEASDELLETLRKLELSVDYASNDPEDSSQVIRLYLGETLLTETDLVV